MTQENIKAGFQRFVFDYSKETGSFNCVIVLDRMKGEEVIPLGKLFGVFKAPPLTEKKEAVQPLPKKPVVPVQEKTEPAAEPDESVQENPLTVVDPSWVLIGKMPSPDGRIVYYYRTKEGKIVYEWE